MSGALPVRAVFRLSPAGLRDAVRLGELTTGDRGEIYVHEDDVAYERLVELAHVGTDAYGQEELVVEVGAVPNGLYHRSTAGQPLGPNGTLNPIGAPPRMEVVPTTHRWIGPLGGDPRDEHSRLDIVEAFDQWPTLIDIEAWAEDYQKRAEQIRGDLRSFLEDALAAWDEAARTAMTQAASKVEAVLRDLQEFTEEFGPPVLGDDGPFDMDLLPSILPTRLVTLRHLLEGGSLADRHLEAAAAVIAAQQEAEYLAAELANRRHAGAVAEEARAWIADGGSPYLRRLLDHVGELSPVVRSRYLDERIGAELPGWILASSTGVRVYPAAAPSEEAFALLDEARESRPDAELVYCRVGSDGPAGGFAAVSADWCGQRVLFPSENLREAISEWEPF